MFARVFPVALAALIFALDQWTKWLIRARLPLDRAGYIVIPRFLNIVHAENPGVAFGFLSDSTSAWRGSILIAVSVLVLGYIAFMLWRSRTGSAFGLRLALALILAGALGNLYDRVTHDTVTDFIEVHADHHYFPVFNVADSSITVGGTLLVLLELLRGRGQRPQRTEANANVSQADLDR
ncbi:MAG TPA: signal peptidase II [Bryobacteraceae bacterium]|nr:signal peptidase II [Bryobacteraceae bacterium]